MICYLMMCSACRILRHIHVKSHRFSSPKAWRYQGPRMGYHQGMPPGHGHATGANGPRKWMKMACVMG